MIYTEVATKVGLVMMWQSTLSGCDGIKAIRM